jgi:hypothetical protein
MARLIAICVLYGGLTLHAGDPYNYSRWWSSLTPQAQHTYIDGYMLGVQSAYNTLRFLWIPDPERFHAPPSKRIADADERLFPKTIDSDVLVPIISDLYKDPSNLYVAPHRLLYIASSKINGQRIDDDLVFERRRAIELHEASEKLQKAMEKK